MFHLVTNNMPLIKLVIFPKMLRAVSIQVDLGPKLFQNELDKQILLHKIVNMFTFLCG